jgi:hypothetical protein
LLGDYWPLLLVAVGLWLLIRPLFRRGKKSPKIVVNISSGDEAEIVDAAPEAAPEPEAEAKEDWETEMDASFAEADKEDEGEA